MQIENLNNTVIGKITIALLVFPIAFFSHENTGIILADLVAIFGFAVFLQSLIKIEAILLVISIILSFIICIYSMLGNLESSIYPIGSIIFFFKPCFAYFAGIYFNQKSTKTTHFFETFSKTSFILLSSVIVTIGIENDGIVRSESFMNGSFFGMNIFGSYGVNSLAIFYALCSFAAAYPIFIRLNKNSSVFFIMIAIGFGYLTVMSLSRTAALGLITMWTVLIFIKFRRKPLTIILFATASIIGLLAFTYTATQSNTFAAKIAQISNGLENNDLDSISSGRISLYHAAVVDIINNPISGTAFRGYGAGSDKLNSFDNIIGLSPHNQYLTTIWKMGPLSALFYFAMLSIMISKALRNSSTAERPWVMGFLVGNLLIFCSTWDILIVPNVGALVFFILGIFASCHRTKNEKQNNYDRVSCRSSLF